MSDETQFSKTTFTFTVLHPSDKVPYDIEDAIASSLDDNVGMEMSAETVGIPDDKVVEEEIALGGDGTFLLSVYEHRHVEG